MNQDVEKKAIDQVRDLKKHYYKYSTKDLISLKAVYEASEEDNKQLSFVVLVLGAVFTFMNLAVTELSKYPTLVNTIIAASITFLAVGSVVLVGINLSKKNRATTLRRKTIELVLSERKVRTKTNLE